MACEHQLAAAPQVVVACPQLGEEGGGGSKGSRDCGERLDESARGMSSGNGRARLCVGCRGRLACMYDSAKCCTTLVLAWRDRRTPAAKGTASVARIGRTPCPVLSFTIALKACSSPCDQASLPLGVWSSEPCGSCAF